MCKFTPLGFETLKEINALRELRGVNLPRWGLKLPLAIVLKMFAMACKFTPLGFETNLNSSCSFLTLRV